MQLDDDINALELQYTECNVIYMAMIWHCRFIIDVLVHSQHSR